MQKVLETYFQNKKDIQISIREKQMEGTIKAIKDGVIHLVGEKYEYHIPIEKIITVGCKLNKKDQKQKKTNHSSLGFKLAPAVKEIEENE